MQGIFLIVENEKEGTILKRALEQYNINVSWSQPNFGNYIKAVQYKPQFILVEINDPKKIMEMITLINRNIRLKNIPMVGYGNFDHKTADRHFVPGGLVRYFQRPMKFTELMKVMVKNVKGLEDAIKVKKTPPSQEQEDENSFLGSRHVTPREKMEVMAGKVANMLAFPFAVAKVVKITADEEASAKALAQAIEADPVISASVLKFSNTVFYASRDRKISDIKDAIVRIGFQETKNIVLSLSVMKLFSQEDKNMGFDRTGFWFHSLAVGLIAEKLMQKSRPGQAGLAFMAGLLHDFGIIILDEFFEELFAKAMDETTTKGACFLFIVKKMLGISHNDVVEILFEGWNLPKEFGYCARFQPGFLTHEDPQLPDMAELSRTVGLANIIAKSLMLGSECDRYVVPVENSMMQQFKLTIGLSDSFREGVYQKLNLYADFMGFRDIRFPLKQTEVSNPDLIRIAFYKRAVKLFSPVEQYLIMQGYALNKVDQLNGLMQKDRHDFLIVETDEKDTMQDILPVMETFKNSKTTPDGYCSVIVLYYPKSPLRGEKPGGPVKMLMNRLDLRMLDLLITYSFQKRKTQEEGGEGGGADTPGQNAPKEAEA